MPGHIILGAADYQRVRTTEPQVLGTIPDKDPGVEFTMLGWTIYGRQPATENSTEKQFFLRSGQEEFEKLCSLDVIGVADAGTRRDAVMHESGYYETKLPWKEDHVRLPTNKNLATARLYSTTKKLEKVGRLLEYDHIMRDQMSDGIIEPIPLIQRGRLCTTYLIKLLFEKMQRRRR